MAIKEVITEEEFKGLQEPMRVLYPHKNPDGTYGLDLEGRDDTTALKNGKKRETDRANLLAKEKAELQAKLKVIDDENAGKLSQAESNINSNWDKRVKDLEENYKKQNDALRKKAEKAEIERVSTSLNGKWLSDEVGQIVLKNRTAIEYEGDDMKTVFLDARGNKTSMNFEDFQKSLVDEPSIKAILKASNASGGGASPNFGSGSQLSYKDMSATEKMALAKSNPDAYLKLKKQSIK